MEAKRWLVLLEGGHLGNGIKLSVTWSKKPFIFCVSEVSGDLS